MKVKVVTDSGTGLTKKEANQLNIGFLPLQIMINNQKYLDGVDIEIHELYDLIEKGYYIQTSMPPLGMIEELFESYKDEEVSDVVLVSVSERLSGTNEAIQAAAKRFGIHIHTLDIYSTLGIQRYLALAAGSLIEKGFHPEEVIRRLKEAVDHSGTFMVCEDLDHLAKSGRLSPAAAKMASLLKVKPILALSEKTGGKVDLFDKVRTMQKAVKKACRQVEKAVKDPNEYHLVILESASEENTKIAEEEFKLMFGSEVHLRFASMPPVIAGHTGLGAICVQYVKKVKGSDKD